MNVFALYFDTGLLDITIVRDFRYKLWYWKGMKGKRHKPTPDELAEIGWMRTGGLRDLGYIGTPQTGMTERWFDEDTGEIIEREVEDIDACLLRPRPAGTPTRKCIP